MSEQPRAPGGEETPPAERPRVRRIDSPPAEPVDVVAVAGGAVAKRAIPAVVVLVVLIVVLVKAC